MIVSQVVQHEYLEDIFCLTLSSQSCKKKLQMEIICDLATIKMREFYILGAYIWRNEALSTKKKIKTT
jgi:hypothetical protein